jgi:hypothetical protein
MAVRMRLTVEGLAAARDRVDDVGDRARRPEPALRSAGALRDLQESERRRFSQARGWRRITPEWAARKRQMGLDPRVMRATGRLQSALVNATDGVRATVFNGQLSWGIRTAPLVRYASAQARQGRRTVVIDRPATTSIAERTQRFIADGFVG